jgi:heme exporter protein B
MIYREIKYLIRKEILQEWKQKFAFQGLMLYVVSTVFVCYLSFRQIIDPSTWNALYWIIILFAGVNAVAKSFMQESRGRILYFYTLADARSIIISKTVYSMMLMLLLALISLFFYSLFVGNPVQDLLLYLLAMLLGTAGFSSVLSMVSAIASRAGSNTTLMAVLSFPVLIPLLITIIRISKNAMDGLAWSVSLNYIIILLALNTLVLTLSYLLFPYLWRE